MEPFSSSEKKDLLRQAIEASEPCRFCRGSRQKEVLVVEGLDGNLIRQGFEPCDSCKGSGYANDLEEFHRTFHPQVVIRLLKQDEE